MPRMNSRWPLPVICFLVLALVWPYATLAQTAIAAASLAGEKAMQEVSFLVLLLRQQQQRQIRADKAVAALATARSLFVESITQIDKDIQALRINEDKNRVDLDRLIQLRADSVSIHAKLKTLTKLSDMANQMNAAQRSGMLERTIQETQAFFSRLKQADQATQASLRSGGSDIAGSVEIRSVQMNRGELAFYMEDYVPGRGWTEVAIAPGQEMRIRSLPVVIRASIQDDNKKRLAAELQKTGHDYIDFEASGGIATQAFLTGHAFRYVSSVGIGESVWTSRGETYKWEADRADRWTMQHLRRVDARDSSPYAKGDIVAIFPTDGTSQNLVFYVEAGTQGWHRQSVLNGKQVARDFDPQNGTASGRIVISVFPK